MAIIDNELIGRGRGSIGDTTYRVVKGRTIASEKIKCNPSNTPEQSASRKAFGASMQLVKTLSAVIRTSFPKTKSGSRQNCFLRENKPLFNYYRERATAFDEWMAPVQRLCIALRDSSFEEDVYAARGATESGSRFFRNAAGKPEGRLRLARFFVAGDVVTVAAAVTGLCDGRRTERVNVFTRTLTGADIAGPVSPDLFVINNDTMPGFDHFDALAPGATDVEVALAAIVTGAGDSSTSVFSLMS